MTRGNVKALTEILESYGFKVTVSHSTDWCGTPLESICATGHGLIDAVAFERDMPLAPTVAEAGVVVKTGERVGYWLRPEKATYWEPHGGIDSVAVAEGVPASLDDPRWQGVRGEAQDRHDKRIGGNAIDVMANAEYMTATDGRWT